MPTVATPVPDVEHSPEPEAFAILRAMTAAAKVPFDPLRTERALRQAQEDIPPTAARAARHRLIQAAEALDLQILSRHLTTHEAVAAAREMPLAIYSVMPGGQARWQLLINGEGKRARLAPLEPGDSDKRLTASELASRLGAADADAVLEWFVAQPALPMTQSLGGDEPADTHGDHSHHGPSPLARVLSLLRAESRDVGIVIVYAMVVGLLSLAVPITAMAVVNTVALATLTQQLFVLCLILVTALVLASMLRTLQNVVVEYIQRRVFTRVVADVAYRLPRVELRAFDRQHGPELVNRFFDVLTVQKSAATLLLDGVDIVLQTCIGLVMLAVYHGALLGFDVLLVLGLLGIVFILGRGAVRTSIAESKAKYEVAGWLEELARNPATFKLGGGPRFALERADFLTRTYLRARSAHFRIVIRQYLAALLLQAAANTALLGLGGYLVIEGQLSLGQLVAAEIVVTLVVASFTKFGKQLDSYYDLLAAVDKLGYLMDLPLERSEGGAHHERGAGAHVRVHQVSFAYDEGRRPVLSDFNVELEPGDRVAIVGPNGAGKTTLVELLFGMRQPDSGYVEIDGSDVRDMRLESLRSHVAIVRGLEIFDGTVVDNVRMGRDELSVADARRALQAVRLLDDILALPDGLQTALSAGGRPLSLGQAERLMLARAIAGQPRLLVLDEALDDMDRTVRQEVLPAVLGPDARWTLLVVTHSPEVAALCQKQIRLERRRDAAGADARSHS